MVQASDLLKRDVAWVEAPLENSADEFRRLSAEARPGWPSGLGDDCTEALRTLRKHLKSQGLL